MKSPFDGRTAAVANGRRRGHTLGDPVNWAHEIPQKSGELVQMDCLHLGLLTGTTGGVAIHGHRSGQLLGWAGCTLTPSSTRAPAGPPSWPSRGGRTLPPGPTVPR